MVSRCEEKSGAGACVAPRAARAVCFRRRPCPPPPPFSSTLATTIHPIPLTLAVDEEKDEQKELGDIVKLSRCADHCFHSHCIARCAKASCPDLSYLICPNCNITYGLRIGAQPDGSMNVQRRSHTLPGFSCPTIQIDFSFPNGTQGPKHPHPGQPYYGTHRTAYLPDNEEGRRVLKLFEVAFERRLFFMVGTSMTTGHSNRVIFAGIHLKTNPGYGEFGYAGDSTYLKRVQEELAGFGVTL